jgi:hypothetical protein
MVRVPSGTFAPFYTPPCPAAGTEGGWVVNIIADSPEVAAAGYVPLADVGRFYADWGPTVNSC